MRVNKSEAPTVRSHLCYIIVDSGTAVLVQDMLCLCMRSGVMGC